jgi:hypothetical protein
MKQAVHKRKRAASRRWMRLRPPSGRGMSGYQVFAFVVICLLFWPLALFLVLRFALGVIRGYQGAGEMP